ncbi:MAG: ribosome maturation factor RimP [Clostridia bacterium]|nr:ribosome maturation factor RimP [Clostridia bacterium]
MSVKETVESIIEPIITEMGYRLVEVSYLKQYGGMTLTIFIDSDKEGGIALDDCEAVSKAIDPILEAHNPTADQSYTLNISSPGIDRPLKSEKDFYKNIGKEIELSLYKQQEGKKKFEGALIAYDSDTVTIKNKEEQKFLRKDIAVIKPVIKF